MGTTGTNTLEKILPNYYDKFFLATPFLEALESGEVPTSVVDEKVRRILRLMLRTTMSENRPYGRANNKEHHDVARKIATEGIVLLKNDNNFFPIQDSKNITIAVIGENATRSMTAGGGSSELKPKFEISPLEGIKARYKNATILYAMGYGSGPYNYDKIMPSPYDAEALKKEALEVAKKADVVLFVGGLNKTHAQDCEGRDRLGFELPYGQDALIKELKKVNKNIGFVLISGNAIDMPWINDVDGVIQTWYLGSMAGHAIADVISGDVNPSGKLPFTFPKKLTDNSAHYFGETSYPGVNLSQEYKEDILVGYRWHDTKNIEPLFAFGHGMSYTDFNIKNVATNAKKYAKNATITVTCNISNTGAADGAEVIQVYVGKSTSKVNRALKELKGFDKIFLKKGETKTVSIKIDVEKLAFYDESISDWNIEEGDYEIYVGNASNNISKKLNITVQ
jgi:beta-glucosidase